MLNSTKLHMLNDDQEEDLNLPEPSNLIGLTSQNNHMIVMTNRFEKAADLKITQVNEDNSEASLVTINHCTYATLTPCGSIGIINTYTEGVSCTIIMDFNNNIKIIPAFTFYLSKPILHSYNEIIGLGYPFKIMLYKMDATKVTAKEIYNIKHTIEDFIALGTNRYAITYQTKSEIYIKIFEVKNYDLIEIKSYKFPYYKDHIKFPTSYHLSLSLLDKRYLAFLYSTYLGSTIQVFNIVNFVKVKTINFYKTINKIQALPDGKTLVGYYDEFDLHGVYLKQNLLYLFDISTNPIAPIKIRCENKIKNLFVNRSGDLILQFEDFKIKNLELDIIKNLKKSIFTSIMLNSTPIPSVLFNLILNYLNNKLYTESPNIRRITDEKFSLFKNQNSQSCNAFTTNNPTLDVKDIKSSNASAFPCVIM